MRKIRLAVGISVLASTLLAGGQPVLAEPTDPAASRDDVPARYLNQKINWKSCYPDGPPPGLPPVAKRLECGSFAAPRDWSRPDDKIDVSIAVSRLPSTGESKASVLTNPGGPGAPGRTTPLLFGDREKLLASQEIIGIDPRGTGDSTNITCDGKAAIDDNLDPRDRSPENLDLILKSNELISQFCQTKSGELGKYINTEQTVRDYDLLRALLGREKINWVGYSGGSWLGAHYATAFPERADKFVLDSNTEFTTSFQESFDWQPMGFERRFREDFLSWLASYDSKYHLGASAEATRRSYEKIRGALAKNPVEVDGEEVTAAGFDSDIVSSLYSKHDFPRLAEYFVNLAALTGVKPEPAAGAKAAVADYQKLIEERGPQLRAPQKYDDAYDASFITITCNDTPWTGTPASVVHKSEQMGKKWPLLGWGWVAQPCISWDRPDVDLPKPTGEGVSPILMVQSVRDAATPIEGARRAHERFEGSRMITVNGEGDHGIYALTDNKCVDDKVESYLVDGTVPAGDSSCPGMPLPDPTKQRSASTPSGLSKVAAYRAASGTLPK